MVWLGFHYFSSAFLVTPLLKLIKQQMYLYQYKLLISTKSYFASCILPFYNIWTNSVFLTLFSFRSPRSGLPMKASKHRNIVIAVSIIIFLLIIIAAVVSAIVISVIRGKFMALLLLFKNVYQQGNKLRARMRMLLTVTAILLLLLEWVSTMVTWSLLTSDARETSQRTSLCTGVLMAILGEPVSDWAAIFIQRGYK